MISNNTQIVGIVVLEGFPSSMKSNKLRKLVNTVVKSVKSFRIVHSDYQNPTWSATIAVTNYECLAMILQLDFA